MEDRDREVEKYLGEFQPLRPRPLPDRVVPKTIWPRRLAAAAVIAIALGTSLWSLRARKSLNGRHSVREETTAATDTKPAIQKLSLVELTQMALKDPERLDAELSEASRRMLPGFRGSDSTLMVLAKE